MLLLNLLQFEGQTNGEERVVRGVVVDGKMPFPLSRSIPSFHLLSPSSISMADVQTNLLSYIITKLHSDVARIESMIHQVHTGP